MRPQAAQSVVKQTIRLSIAYDGSSYQGWQSQRSGKTVQDTISYAIFVVTGERVRLTGASRTDAGVHSLEQVAAFETSSRLSPDTVRRALNANLPADIRVLTAETADEGFHPRYDALGKTYCYLIHQGELSSAFLHRYVWHIRNKLDSDAMKKASACLIGVHDFSSFRGSGCGAKHPKREIVSLSITHHRRMSFMTMPVRGDFLRIEIQANAFLRHMARNIVGTLAEVGRGSIPHEQMKKILQSCRREDAGPTAPASGLFLKKIIYERG